MAKTKINIDTLIDIVSKGGTVCTGVDIYDEKNVLILEKDITINTIKPLIYIKNNGFQTLSIDSADMGGIWDRNGKPLIKTKPDNTNKENDEFQVNDLNIKQKLDEIKTLKIEASKRYNEARKSIKKVLDDIKLTGGEFDQTQVENTVTDLLEFLSLKENAFSYLSREIFSYDTYLYNHCINVCTIGTTILKKFNDHFSQIINSHLSNYTHFTNNNTITNTPFTYYLSEDIYHIALGFFLHDVGKVLIPDEILNKEGRLSDKEFELVKTHSYEKGVFILEKNGQDNNPFIRNSVKYHHSPLFANETNCYPIDSQPSEIPTYVKICKLADIYDAMTSKRCYKEAVNPISVVTELFRKYAEKDSMLQFILHSFVKSVGIFPPGSIINMQNGQMVYILDSEGPLVIPITDTQGVPLSRRSDPIKLGTDDAENKGLRIDRREPLISPVKAYDMLPDYLKQTFIK